VVLSIHVTVCILEDQKIGKIGNSFDLL